MQKIKRKLYKASSFFSTDFPFFIKRSNHTAMMFNEKTLHQREFWKIIYVEEGRGFKIINDSRYPMKSGSLFLIHPDDITSFIIKSPSLKVCDILFLPEFLGDCLHELSNEYQFFSIFSPDFQSGKENDERLYILKTDRDIKNLLTGLQQEYVKKSVNYKVMLRMYLTELLVKMGRQGIQSMKRYRRHNVVAYIDHMIRLHYADEFNLDMLAGELEMDKSSLCRLFKRSTGLTVMNRLLLYRLEKSRMLLADPQITITAACYECGFRDLSYFYRAFKKHMGFPPGEYRQRIGLD